MFLGSYEYRIDAKGRVPLPPKFREKLKQGLVLTHGLERCVTVYPLSEWMRIAENSATLPAARSKDRRMNRFTFATSFSVELDAQGRVALPAPLRQFAEIGENVVIVGANNYAEIWSDNNWQNEVDLMEREAWQISESMEGRN
ncbi:division/cell wall cluster transcriptional repressor MraZ [Chloroflexota bacterium]